MSEKSNKLEFKQTFQPLLWVCGSVFSPLDSECDETGVAPVSNRVTFREVWEQVQENQSLLKRLQRH